MIAYRKLEQTKKKTSELYEKKIKGLKTRDGQPTWFSQQNLSSKHFRIWTNGVNPENITNIVVVKTIALGAWEKL